MDIKLEAFFFNHASTQHLKMPLIHILSLSRDAHAIHTETQHLFQVIKFTSLVQCILYLRWNWIIPPIRKAPSKLNSSHMFLASWVSVARLWVMRDDCPSSHTHSDVRAFIRFDTLPHSIDWQLPFSVITSAAAVEVITASRACSAAVHNSNVLIE